MVEKSERKERGKRSVNLQPGSNTTVKKNKKKKIKRRPSERDGNSQETCAYEIFKEI